MKCYIIDKTKKEGFKEISKSEFIALFGDDMTKQYVRKVYHNQITFDEVPEELRETVQTTVNNRIAQFGRYEDCHISSSEALSIITGGN